MCVYVCMYKYKLLIPSHIRICIGTGEAYFALREYTVLSVSSKLTPSVDRLRRRKILSPSRIRSATTLKCLGPPWNSVSKTNIVHWQLNTKVPTEMKCFKSRRNSRRQTFELWSTALGSLFLNKPLRICFYFFFILLYQSSIGFTMQTFHLYVSYKNVLVKQWNLFYLVTDLVMIPIQLNCLWTVIRGIIVFFFLLIRYACVW